MMKLAAEVAVAIKLGAELELSDFNLDLEDMIEYFKCKDVLVGVDNNKSVASLVLKEDVIFFANGMRMQQDKIFLVYKEDILGECYG